MFAPTVLGTFMVVVLGLFLIPGPAVLFVISRTIQSGRTTGLMTGLGVATGDFIHTMGAAIGLSAILMTSALVFNLIKYAGVAYLLYLGVKAFIEKQSDPHEVLIVKITSPKKAFFQAIAVEVLNPKTALFFLAFIPQFVHPERSSAFLQFIVLGLIFVVMSACYTTLLVFAIRPISHIMGKLTNLKRWQGKIIGTIFISLGLKLALQER